MLVLVKVVHNKSVLMATIELTIAGFTRSLTLYSACMHTKLSVLFSSYSKPVVSPNLNQYHNANMLKDIDYQLQTLVLRMIVQTKYYYRYVETDYAAGSRSVWFKNSEGQFDYNLDSVCIYLGEKLKQQQRGCIIITAHRCLKICH